MSIGFWKTITSELIFNHPWCRLRKDTIELPSGKVIDDYFVHIKADVALTVPITEEKEVIFVKQYRHAVGKIVLELPAGKFNPQEEDPASAAGREMSEETGYVSQEILPLATLYEDPGNATNRLHLFLAPRVIPTGKKNWDLTEEIEVVSIPLAEIRGKIASGEICVSGTVSALLLALNRLDA